MILVTVLTEDLKEYLHLFIHKKKLIEFLSTHKTSIWNYSINLIFRRLIQNYNAKPIFINQSIIDNNTIHCFISLKNDRIICSVFKSIQFTIDLAPHFTWQNAEATINIISRDNYINKIIKFKYRDYYQVVKVKDEDENYILGYDLTASYNLSNFLKKDISGKIEVIYDFNQLGKRKTHSPS